MQNLLNRVFHLFSSAQIQSASPQINSAVSSDIPLKLFVADTDQGPVSITLTKEQIAQYNGLIRGLNKVISHTNIPSLDQADEPRSTLYISAMQARHVSWMLQLAHVLKLTGDVPYIPKTAFNAAAQVTAACGYGGGAIGPIKQIDEKRIYPAVKLVPGSIMKFDFHVGDSPIEFYSRSSREYYAIPIGRDGEFTSKKARATNKALTYFDNEVAFADIRNNAVMNAMLFLNSDELQQLAISALDNSSLKKLTLKLAGPVTVADAKQVALILRREGMHLRKLELPEATFQPGALYIIQKALAVNGLVTRFAYPAVTGPEGKTIKTILARNKALTFNRRKYGENFFLGGSIGAAFFLITHTLVVYPLIPVISSLSLSFLSIVGLSYGIAAVIGALGAAAGCLYTLYQEYQYTTAVKDLHCERVANQADPSNKLDIMVTPSQYLSAMKGLTSEEKVDVTLRSSPVDEVLNQRAAHKKDPAEKAAAQADRLLAATSGQGLMKLQMSSARYSLLAQVRSTQIVTAQFKAYPLSVNQRKFFNTEGIEKASKRYLAKCYDAYGDTKFGAMPVDARPAVIAK